jgi:myo-inositol-1(or 4)-monophosphatase
MKSEYLEHARTLSPEAGLAVEAALRGAEVLLKYYQRLGDADVREKGRGDLVTSADVAAEKVITEFLRRAMPEAAVLAEEGTATSGNGPVWYVDPLDGTTNFVQQFPVFAVSVALADNDDRHHAALRCGAVFNPVSGDLFYGARGKGSYICGRRLSVSPKRDLGDAVFATGFPRRFHEELPMYLREFDHVFRSCRAVRRAGSAALDLCWTAQGVFDGFWEHRLSPWDIGAGVLIVEEAGGVCTDFSGACAFLDSGNIIGAAPDIHRQLLAMIGRVRSSS